MQRQLSLTSLSLAVVAFLSIPGTADAKQCKVDSDCADGFECQLGDSAGSGGSTGKAVGGSAGQAGAVGTACAGPDCPVSSPAYDPAVPKFAAADAGAAPSLPNPVPPLPPTTDAGTVPAPTTGVCRVKTLVCSSKANCPAGLDCVKQTVMAPRPTCAPNTACDTPLNTPTTLETGTCQAVCNVDSDCPSPLVCTVQGETCSGGGSVSSDGKVTTMPTTCTGGNKVCSYVPVACSVSDPCKLANFQCAKVSEYQSCSGSAPTACARPKDGSEAVCTPTPAEPPVCTAVVVNNCMPSQIRCAASADCPAGWSCFDFSYFEEAKIPGWTTPMPTKACLPDGIILAIKGQASGGSVDDSYSGSNPTRGGSGAVDLGGGGGSSWGTGGSTGGSVPVANGSDPLPPQSGPVPATNGEKAASSSDAGVEPSSARLRDGGCTYGGQGSANLWLTLGLAGLVLRLCRRRK